MSQHDKFRRSRRWLTGSIAGILILLAVVVGVARLLLPMAPDYQDQIRRIASEATGFDIRFGRLSATWPISGPELQLYDVHITTREGDQQVLAAGQLSVRLSLWQLIADRQLRPGRIAISDASVRIEHLPSGEWQLNGVPLDELLHQREATQIPRLDVRLKHIAIVAVDPARLEKNLALRLNQFDLALSPERGRITAEFDGTDGLGSNIELSGELPVALLRRQFSRDAGQDRADERAVDWELKVTGGDLDVARWLRIVADQPVPLLTGRGALELTAAFTGMAPRAMTMDLALGPSTWAGLADARNNYQSLELRARWSTVVDGWEATLERFAAERGGKTSPAATGQFRYTRDGDGPATFAASLSALRLQDAWPVLWSFAGSGLQREALPEQVQGTVDNLQLAVALPADAAPTWQAEGKVRNVGVRMPESGWAVTGVTGSFSANQNGGQAALGSRGGIVRLPWLFRADIQSTSATGNFTWTVSPRGLELASDDFRATTGDAEGRARLRLIFPHEGSVFVDVAAQFKASSAPAALEYLPLMHFKPQVVEWLDQAVIAGVVPRADLRWQGRLRAFPYESGDGQFRVEVSVADAVLNYAPDWPRLQDASGTVIFDRASLSSVDNQGAVGGVPFADAEIHIADLLHDAELDVAAADNVQFSRLLGFLRQTPVAQLLGPTLESVTGSGTVRATVNLKLPIATPKDYRLNGSFELAGATLGLKNVALGLSGLDGTVQLDGSRLVARQLTGRFLDEPVNIQLRAARADEPLLTQVAEIRGDTPVDKLAAAFSLPYATKLAGAVNWAATVEVPARQAARPVAIQITSDLQDLAVSLATPLNKAAGVREPLSMEIRLPERGHVEVSGHIRRDVSWALEFLSGPQLPAPPPATVSAATAQPAARSGWRLARGSLRSGPVVAQLPKESGFFIGGNFASLRFEDWFAGGDADEPGAGADSILREIDIEAGRFTIFDRSFRDVQIDARRATGNWLVAVRGPSVAGVITVPLSGQDHAPVVLDLQRLWLVSAGPASGTGQSDPRKLPDVKASIANFSLNDMHFGQLSGELSQRGDGIAVDPLKMVSPSFRIDGNLSWVVVDNDVSRQRSEARLTLKSTNSAQTLKALGYDPVVESEKAAVTLDLVWPGGPREDFLGYAGGRVSIDLDRGQFLPVDPGGGRLVGLLSIATLPRRLGLDFSDLVDKGLAFDQVKGEFRLEAGNAFTCNLGLEGPATDIGIVGKVSLKDRDYDQVAVVRPHVSDVLAVGGFVGGPVLGGAVLLISQLFRKPLSSLGESYYRIAGNWDKPQIEKVQKDEVDVSPFKDCTRYLADALQQLPPDAELKR